MNLKSIKKDLSKVKKSIGVESEPTITNFYKYCEQFYNRPVHIGEMLFDDYKVSGETVKPNPALFLKLSDQYYREIHQVPNPFKDGEEHSLKLFLSHDWFDVNKPKAPYNTSEDLKDPDYTAFFDKAWAEFMETGDLTAFVIE